MCSTYKDTCTHTHTKVISSNISPTVAKSGHSELPFLMAPSLQYGAIRRDKAQRLLG